MTYFMTRLLEHPVWKKIHETTFEKSQIKAGKQHKYNLERIAAGNDLKSIQDMKAAPHTNPLVKKYTNIVNKFTLFVANKTYGNYPEARDQEQPSPIYQDIAQKRR